MTEREKLTACRVARVTPQVLDAGLHDAEFLVKVQVVDDGGVVLYLLQHGVEVPQILAVALHGVLYKVVARRTVHAGQLPVVLVLLAPVTLPALHVVQTLDTLTVAVLMYSHMIIKGTKLQGWIPYFKHWNQFL